MKIGLIFAVLLALAVPAAGGELSDYERRGLYFCSTEGTVDVVVKEGNFYMIIFREVVPAVFVKKEVLPEFKAKIESLRPGQQIKVVCIHRAFRDDWQEVYDRDREVWPKLIDILN